MPYMRKWMRERLQRRKKPQEAKSSEPAQAPLQPAYFEGDSSSVPTIEREEPQPEVASAAPVTEAPAEVPVVETANQETASGRSAIRTRRRRGRGGRGRGGSKPTPSPARAMEAGEPITPKPEAEPSPAQPIPAAPARPPKGAVVLAIGLPGSGKSSWFKRHNITPLSSDMLRMLLFDDAQEQRFQDLVFSNLRSMLKARLIARRPLNYVDATNLTPHERHSWIKLAKDYGYEVQAVFFDVPVEVCLERNQRRDRVVDEDILRRMAAKLKPPTFEEGFSKVTVWRVKKKENEAAS